MTDLTFRLPDGGLFGIERETLRLGRDLRLAQTPHPFHDPAMDRDFCECQLELITPPCPSVHAACEALGDLDRRARAVLEAQDETLWLFSTPPHVPDEADIPIAQFAPPLEAKNVYRRYLAEKYGKRLMLYSGIHFNLSFPEEAIEALRQTLAPTAAPKVFHDRFYLHLAKATMLHSWLLVLLTAASPVRGLGSGHAAVCEDASPRSGAGGYWNRFCPILDYRSLATLVDGMEQYVRKGQLYSAAELYLPVRLKPFGANEIGGLLTRGVSHIELRMFDLDPLDPLGIDERDLTFAHLLLRYLAVQPEFTFTPAQQAWAIRRHQAAAALHPAADVLADAAHILDRLAAYYADDEAAAAVIAFEQQKLTGERYAEILADLPEESLLHLIRGACRCRCQG